MILDGIDCLLLDLDGTVYVDGKPIGDMINTLEKIRRSGRKLIYLTNNSSRSNADYVNRLKKSGLFGDGDAVYTAGDATISYLKNNFPGKSVCLIGTESLENDFKKAGIGLCEDSDVLVLALDTTIDYEKIKNATYLINRGAFYIATHPDATCPSSKCFVPDVGSFIALFERATGRLPDAIAGKPGAQMAEEIVRRTGFDRKRILMVGDRLSTDIKFGVDNGMKTLLVLSGDTDRETYEKSDLKATYVLDSLNDAVKNL